MAVYLVLFVVFINGENGVITRMHPDLPTCEVAKITAQRGIEESMSKDTSVRGYNLDCVITTAPKRGAA